MGIRLGVVLTLLVLAGCGDWSIAEGTLRLTTGDRALVYGVAR